MGTPATHSSKYRPDIDGLRALAILPVMFYHAQLGCPGGFVGVDVFFVISGFLITSLILDELAEGTFSLVHFWERRIRRILPAATVVMLATLAVAYCLFVPGEFILVGKSAAAQAVFAGNFFFWKYINYFAPLSEARPLLHMWSLAVEEQFYLLFPLWLLFLMRFGKKSVLAGIAALALGSFALSVAWTSSGHNLKTAFFLLPGRAWELMLGALLAAFQGKISVGGWWRELSGWLGLALILWPVFWFSKDTRFPGLGALPPCLGAALIIFSNETKLSSLGHVLAWRPLVFTGLISYSLYLWHWPLLAFVAYPMKYPPGAAIQIATLAASYALAWLSWRWIERPFRRRKIAPQRPQVFAFAGVSLATVTALGLVVVAHEGFVSRFPASVMAYADARQHTPYQEYTDMRGTWADHLAVFSTTHTNQPADLVIWGDSHAMAVAPVIDTLCQQQGWSDMEATFPGTPPVVGRYYPKDFGARPNPFSAAVFKYIGQTHPRAVVLAARWAVYTASDDFKSNLLATVRSLQGLGTRVYVVRDEPTPGYNVPRIAALTAMHHGDIDLLGVKPKNHAALNQEWDPVFKDIAGMGVSVLDPAPYFLNRDGLYAVENGGKILYCDEDHLSVDGAMFLTPLFQPIFHVE